MIDSDSAKTRHELIAEKLGEFLLPLAAGTKLPPVRHLMDKFNGSQATIDRSLHNLEERGLIKRIAGRGYFRHIPVSKPNNSLKIDCCFFFRKNVLNNPLYSKIRDMMLSEMYHLGCFMNFLIYEDIGCITEFRNRIQRSAPNAFIMLGCSKVSFNHVLQDLGIPSIQLYPNVIENNALSYIIDNEHAIHLAVDHLCGFGHRRIAFLHGQGFDGCHILDQEERIESFYSIMDEKKLSTTGQLVKYGGFSPKEGYIATMELLNLSSRSRPTAIICNDYNASGVYQAAEEKGLRIPEDLSVVGFDNLSIINFMRPSLTTIDICVETMIKELADVVFKLAQSGKAESGLVRSKVSLIIANSTGKVNG